MAVTDQQKIDFLLKKIGYTKTKTGSVDGTGSVSGTPKQPFAEAIASPLVVPNSSLWNEADSIPATPPGSDTQQVKVYSTTSAIRMTVDVTSSGNRAYIAYSTYNDTSSARLTNWIDTQFGSGYLIKVFKNDPTVSANALSAGATNENWFFDYSAGVLNFNDTNVPTHNDIYIVGYRYIGQTGAPTSGISTFSFLDLTVQRNLDTVGIATLGSGASGQADLQYQGSTKLNTASWGVQLNGTLQVSDGDPIFTRTNSNSTSNTLRFRTNTGDRLTIQHLNNENHITGVVGNIGINAPQVSISTDFSVGGISTVQDLHVNGNNILMDHGGSMAGVTTIGSYYYDKIHVNSVFASSLLSDYSDTVSVGDPIFPFQDVFLRNDVTGFNMITAGIGSTHVNLTVTVATKSTDHRYHGQGSTSGYLIGNGNYNSAVQSPFMTFTPGRKYRFNQSDYTNANHQIKFYLEADRTTLYETGVTYNGTAGNAGAYTEIEITDITPKVLYYQCVNHPYMGNAFQTNSNSIITSSAISGVGNAFIGGNTQIVGITTFGSSGQAVISDNGNFTTSGEIRVSNGQPGIVLEDTNANPDFIIQNRGGSFAIRDLTNAANRFLVDMANGDVTVTGVINGVNATFSGDVSIGGTLTYEDVNNVDSVGLGTFREGIFIPDNKKVQFGNAAGNADLEIYHDGSHNIFNASNGFVKFNNNVFQVYNQGGNNLSFEIVPGSFTKLFHGTNERLLTTSTGVVVTGILTATSADINGDLDVDGHTNLDNVSIAGVTTITSSATSALYVAGRSVLGNDQLLPTFGAGTKAVVADLSGNGNYVDLSILGGRTGRSILKFGDHDDQDAGAIKYYHTDDSLNFFTNGSTTEKLIIKSTGNVEITNDLDVDGHTNLDNVSVSGIITAPNIDIDGGGSTLMTLKFHNNLTGSGINDGAAINYSTNSHGLFFSAYESQGSMIFQTGANHLNNRTLLISNTGVVTLQRNQESMLVATPNSDVKLYYDGEKRFATTGVGATIFGNTETQTLNVTGVSTFQGVIEASAGENKIPSLYQDLSDLPSPSTYHGLFAHVHNVGRGYFSHAGGWYELVNREFGGTVGTGTDVYDIGTLNTSSLNVTGISTFKDDVEFHGASGITSVSFDKSDNSLKFVDNAELKFGDSNDLLIRHLSNGDSAITEGGGGALYIGGSRIIIADGYSSNYKADFTGNEVKLYYSNDKKFSTTEVGVTVYNQLDVENINATGIITAVSFVGDGSSLTGLGATDYIITGTAATFTGGVNINSDLDVDGHTNLDNVSIAGVATFSSDATFNGSMTLGGTAGINGQYLKTTGNGVAWASFPTMRTKQTTTASAGQTIFSFSYNVGFLDVYVNGVKLTDAEFTATNGSAVILAVGCFVGDIVELVSFNTVSGGGGGGGTGITIQDEGSALSTSATALDFVGTGVVASGTGSTKTITINAGIAQTAVITSDAITSTELDVTGISTFSNTVDVNSDLDVDGHTELDNVNIAGVVTASDIRSNSLEFKNAAGGQSYATFSNGGGATLKWNNTDRLETKSGGVDVIGTVNATAFVGDGSGLTGITGGSGATINNNADNRLITGSNTSGTLEAESTLTYTPSGSNNKLALTGADSYINVGANSNRFELRNNGSSSYLYHYGAGTFHIALAGSSSTIQIDSISKTIAQFNKNAGCNFYWNNTKRLETTDGGAIVTGVCTATKFVGDGSGLTGLPGGGTGVTADSFDNTFAGTDAGISLGINSTDNTFFGFNAGRLVNNGDGNTCLGANAGDAIQSGNNNVAVGYESIPNLIGGSENTAVGKGAGNALTSGSDNTFLGYMAGATTNGTYNVCVGSLAGANGSGNYNVSLGYYSNWLGGSDTVAIGRYTLSRGNSQTGSIGIGYYAGYNNAANYSVYIGYESGYGLGTLPFSTGENNVGIGYQSLYSVTTGQNNTVLGRKSGYTLTTGSNNLILGNEAEPSSASISNEITFGNSAITKVRIPGINLVLDDNGATLTQGHVLTIQGNGEAKFSAPTGGGGGGGGGPDVGITTSLAGSFNAVAGNTVTIDTYSYSSNDLVFEYTVYIKNVATSEFQTQKVLASRDGTNIQFNQFGVMFSNSLIAQLSVTVSSGNINLRITPESGVSGSTDFRLKREVM